MADNLKTEAAVEWLKVVIALIAALLLAVIYVALGGESPGKGLLLASIPSAIVVLVAIPLVYLVFYLPGLTQAQLARDSDRFAEQVAAQLKPALSNIMGTYEPHPTKPVASFHETFRYVDWPELMSVAHNRIDIVVYYFDSWVNAHYEALVAFFRRPGTTMRVFLSDPSVSSNLQTIQRLFPEYSETVIDEKVTRTGDRLGSALHEAGGKPSRLEVYYLPYTLNYSAQCIDGKILVLSFFEMFRDKRIDAPAVSIDLTQAEQVAKFWQKELDGLIENAKQVSGRSGLGNS